MTSYTRDGEDVPDIVPGEVVHSHNGDLAYTVIKQVSADLPNNAKNVPNKCVHSVSPVLCVVNYGM